MHQRDQESIMPGRASDAVKVVRHKPFYAAEVVLNGLDLRTMMAIFAEPLKQSVNVTSSGQRSTYRMREDLPVVESASPWFDIDDFVETDWLPLVKPTLHLLPMAACSRLTYFKRNSTSSESPVVTSKFGVEDSHSCLLGKESCGSQSTRYLCGVVNHRRSCFSSTAQFGIRASWRVASRTERLASTTQASKWIVGILCQRTFRTSNGLNFLLSSF